MKVPVALAYRVTDDLSIGGSVGLGVCNAEFEGPYFLNGPTLPGIPTEFHAHGWGADFVWSAGMQYQYNDCTTFGAAYQSSPAISVLIGNSAVTVPGVGRPAYDSEMYLEWPQSVSLGVRRQVGEFRSISADVVWFDWSHSFDRIGLALHGPGNELFPQQIDRERAARLAR